MASTTNNSGLDGNVDDVIGPAEKWDDETDDQYRQRMVRRDAWLKDQDEYLRNRMPPCIG